MEGGEGGEDESMQDEAEEGRRFLFRKSEGQPPSQDVQEHMNTHIPDCSWCAHCVRGRGRNDPHRSGAGRRGHSEIQCLWLQEAVRNNKLTVEKISSETNSSELGTMHLTSERSEMLMKFVNCFHV